MKLGLNSISIWLGFIMILLVISGAAVFSLSDFMSEELFGKKRFYFILMLVAYSVYRSFRLYHAIKQANKNDA